MFIETLLKGESSNLEYKVAIPKDSLKYMKTVVAFANGAGGRIVFGIDDSRTVVGIEQDNIFAAMDSIANAISDNCEPAIIPDITLQTIDNKTVIIVEVSEGRQRPYFIKSLGQQGGTYIRVGSTSRLADICMIKELLFEGSNRFFDKTVCLDLEVSEDDINSLCQKLKEVAIKNTYDEKAKSEIRDVTKQQLLSWGILTERDGKIVPTNGYGILTGSYFLPHAIQCGVFKGTTKAVFVDRREYTGFLPDQIEQAYDFVLRNIHLGAEFQGLYRQDKYEIPQDAIRELIINAAVHRSYLDNGNIQIAIYDDRLEITSPGKLPMNQSISKMKEGYSKIRNEALASAFAYMKLIEHWGSGIPRILNMLKEAGLSEPEFIGGDTELRINIYRKGFGDNENISQQKDLPTKKDDEYYKENIKSYLKKVGKASKVNIERAIVDDDLTKLPPKLRSNKIRYWLQLLKEEGVLSVEERTWSINKK